MRDVSLDEEVLCCN